jgi:TonB family protein
MTRTNEMGIEIGLLSALLLVNVLFQLVPAGEIGRLSSRTFDDAMEAVDAFLPYDSSIENKQDEVIEDQLVINEQVQDAIQNDLVISLSADTTGLSIVSTVETSLIENDVTTDEIGPPGFCPAEVLPVCTFMPPPVYPEMARLAGVEGVVTLWVYIDRNGAVQDARLMNSSGVASLDDAALSAVYNTRWNAARNNSVPTGVWTTLRYNFALTD